MAFIKKIFLKKRIILFISVAVLFLLLHSTPNTALRTKVFFMGYPKAALTSPIIDDVYHNEVDKDQFAEMNAKAYTLTKPPIEKATQGELRNYVVKRLGFIYFAEYYGEG
ncbi:hypothetical protein ACFFJI_00695 [Allobacillus sp. GCM10007491]|uniref:Uncharacterized protein n=1 Tax=Allobacillus saliphilus TaxID=2912308 RepID=A0A941CTN6_9BACI|nr:hypothetical protein [Allobacillus saliphilus]MBR7553738.1 hypothetical protein [Allobacillus saliphilus]